MRIEVHLFAAAAQTLQARSVTIYVVSGASLADLASELAKWHPQIAPLLSVSRWAIDHQFASLDTTVSDQQEIALIPPVSGG